jgi:hypothetical protein
MVIEKIQNDDELNSEAFTKSTIPSFGLFSDNLNNFFVVIVDVDKHLMKLYLNIDYDPHYLWMLSRR